MTIEVEVLAETYTILKQYIPGKDRQEAADNLISVMVDLLSDEELKVLADSDTTLAKAVKEYSAEFDDGDYDQYDD